MHSVPNLNTKHLHFKLPDSVSVWCGRLDLATPSIHGVKICQPPLEITERTPKLARRGTQLIRARHSALGPTTFGRGSRDPSSGGSIVVGGISPRLPLESFNGWLLRSAQLEVSKARDHSHTGVIHLPAPLLPANLSRTVPHAHASIFYNVVQLITSLLPRGPVLLGTSSGHCCSAFLTSRSTFRIPYFSEASGPSH